MPYGFGRRVCLGESLAKDTLRIFFATLVKHIRCWKSLIYFLLVIFNQPGKVYRPCESSSTGPRKLHRDLNSYPRCLSRKYRTDQACLKKVIRFMLQLYFLLENCQINLLVVIPLPHPAVYLMIPHIVLCCVFSVLLSATVLFT